MCGELLTSGLLVFEQFHKLFRSGKYTFGPAKADEVLPLVSKCVLPGSSIFSDELAAYKKNLTEMGFTHDYVKLEKGQYVKCNRKLKSKMHIGVQDRVEMGVEPFSN